MSVLVVPELVVPKLAVSELALAELAVPELAVFGYSPPRPVSLRSATAAALAREVGVAYDAWSMDFRWAT
ncbi:MAG: hypothetical protein ACXW61_11795, partial [Gemmatirosa sp.]